MIGIDLEYQSATNIESQEVKNPIRNFNNSNSNKNNKNNNNTKHNNKNKNNNNNKYNKDHIGRQHESINDESMKTNSFTNVLHISDSETNKEIRISSGHRNSSNCSNHNKIFNNRMIKPINNLNNNNLNLNLLNNRANANFSDNRIIETSFNVNLSSLTTTTSETLITENKTQTDMNKSEYAFKKTLNNIKSSFKRNADDDETDDDDLHVINDDLTVRCHDDHKLSQIINDVCTDAAVGEDAKLFRRTLNADSKSLAPTVAAAAVTAAKQAEHFKINLPKTTEMEMKTEMMQPATMRDAQSHLGVMQNAVVDNCAAGQDANFFRRTPISRKVGEEEEEAATVPAITMINLKLLWPPKQLQFNQSDVLPDNKKLSKMVNYQIDDTNIIHIINDDDNIKNFTTNNLHSINHNNKMYQIQDIYKINNNNDNDDNIKHNNNNNTIDNNKINNKDNILNATETFCDNYKNELNVAKSDKKSSKNINTTTSTTTTITSSLKNDTTIKTTYVNHCDTQIAAAKNTSTSSVLSSTTTATTNASVTSEMPSNTTIATTTTISTIDPTKDISNDSNIQTNHEQIIINNNRANRRSQCSFTNASSISSPLPLKPHITFDKLIELIDSEPKRIHQCQVNGIKVNRLMRLCGGGEQAINNGTTGWGSPPSAAAGAAASGSNANAGSWGTATNQPTPQGWGNASPQQPSSQQPNPQQHQSQQQVSMQQQQQQRQSNEQLQNKGAAATSQQVPSTGQSQQSMVGLVAGQQQPQSQPPQQPTQQSGSNNNNNNVGPNNQATGNNNNNNSTICNPASGLIGGGTSTAAAKNQLEQLTTMREALFSQDGWGCQHVNQDTNWDVPGSPEPMNAGNIVKVDPAAQSAAAGAAVPTAWKPNINNGTELWEANLRNGGQPPTPVQKTPWGHTPSTNLGGTWGEDDDGGDSANVWAGTQSNQAAPQWNQASASNTAVNVNAANANVGQNAAMWPPAPGATGSANAAGNIVGGNNVVGAANPGQNVANMPADMKRGGDNEWVASNVNNSTGGNWANPRDVRNVAGNQIDIRNADPRGMSNASHFNIPIVHQRDPTRDLLREISRDMTRDVRGDLRGISGRLNGTSEMWGQHHNLTQPQPQSSQMNKMIVPAGTTGVTEPTPQQSQQPQSQQPPHGQMPMNKMIGPTADQWGSNAQISNQTKDMQMQQSKPSGWEQDPSPPTQRRNIPNFDDGTSLWSQQQQQQASQQQQPNQQQPQQPVPMPQNRAGLPVSNAHWPKGDMPDLSRNLMRNAVDQTNNANVGGATTPQGRIIPSGLVKQDGSMWAQNSNNAAGMTGRTSSWDETTGSHGSNWDDKNAAMGNISGNAVSVVNFTDAQSPGVWQQQQQQQQQKNKQLMGTGGSGSMANPSWPETDLSDWNHGNVQTSKQQQNKMAALELIRNSKQYRMLFDMGFKKEEIELALRATNLNMEEAMEILNQSRSANSMDAWRRHDEHNTGGGNFDHNNFPQRYPTGPQQMPFPPNNNPNLLNSIGVSGASTNPCLTAIGNMQPMQAQKFLNQGAHNASNTGNTMTGGFNQGISGINQSLNATGNSGNTTPAAGQPSTQQLRMLVQQIQMAVQAGYLNHQILNQPLAPTTLVLLNQLLTNIKQLQVSQANLNRGINNIHMTLTISKLKQQIATLQNQIAQQQAAYVNKQPGGGNHNMGGNGNVGIGAGIGIANIGNVANAGPSANDYLRNQHDPINSLQGTFSEMSMAKEPPNSFQNSSGQQSRLNQWKLPNFDKEGTDNTTDFSRAPGTTSKSTMSTTNSVIGSLGLQGDGTWSSGRSVSDGWPDSTPDSENKDWPSSQQSPATAFTDLVPEFEPGKPWKGSQMKTIEDDPSITPGSVARSPLSISAAKDSDLFATSSKTSPTDLPPLSLSSSTWSFNPTGSSSQPHFTSSSKGSNWSDGVSHQMGNQSELWSAPMPNKPARGPPPGLSNNNKGSLSGSNTIASTSANERTNGWIGTLSSRVGGTNNWSSGNNGSWPSTWLLLKNMTAQIDGSTLRTLCMQHGPLQHFHLYLNHGIALCKYSSREEANKAQMALNNCVLGNTTICAESPGDSEVQNILQHLGVPNQPPQQPQQQQPQQPNQQQPQPPQSQPSAAATTASGNTIASKDIAFQWRTSQQPAPNRSSGSDTWGAGSVWPSANPAGNFWTGLDAASNERATPSSLNSLLPENLLGNELN